ncbi:universal stress protein A [Desulfacinum hydrothermale DSM 13146]|uniref:Universal stress protein n=1 Tax=Desulfacinum hydrothermale DSM 13146 TaxID=1121390 RepID=A0A1W1WZA3_9BACT|nr:universal stress protein [Desulfacinum hydrothermale]SMC16947.1 universal stress protein A [Desulfacinum hydrothermale DSM 13146]
MIRVEKILVPVDFSEYSQKAVKYGVELAKDRKASLTLLHVINQRIIDAVHELSVKGYKGDFVEVMRKMVTEREAELQQMVPQDWREGLTELNFEIRKGRPSEEVIQYAREHGMDLIVVGTHGRSALASVLLGSVANTVVLRAPCPVLVVRAIEHDFVE